MSTVKQVGTGGHHVLCLHGWFGSAEGWGYWPEVADRHGYTWWFPEMRGYGARRGETGEFTMKEYAADTLAAADAAGVDRFSVVGHSMGGKAAASLLAQAPDRVRALVGVSPVAPAPVPLDDEGHGLFFGAPDSDENRRAILDLTTGNRNSDAWLDDMVADSREASDVAAFTGAVESWVGDDYLADVGRPATPILCIVGENDPALSAEVMRQSWLQIYPNATLEELPSCGHYAMHESPVWLATRIESFLGDK
ncbi:MAG: alpha/beta fold hydrolase [Marmoricola sp.]